MATAPTFVDEQETALDSTSPKSVGASLSALNGDILVEVAGVEHAFLSLGTPTGGTSVTRTQQAIEDAGVDTRPEVRLWVSRGEAP